MNETDVDSKTVEHLKSELDKTETDKIDLDAQAAYDDIKDFYEYKKHLRDSAKKQIDFKDKIRWVSLVIFGLISLLLFTNMFVMLYLQDLKFNIGKQSLKIPHYDAKLIIFFASATFVNTFGIIGFLLRYIYSPTKDILKHNEDLSKK